MGSLKVVAFGSSAGGVESIKRVVQNLPKVSDISYIFIQHLNPAFNSILSDIISKYTTLEIVKIKNSLKIEPNKIYICSVAKDVEIENGKFKLLDTLNRPTPSIDRLFISLANHRNSKVVGVVLSGTGNDGTKGVEAIKQAGGVTIAQSLESAEYSNMSQSAIESGYIDLILDIDDISEEIEELFKYNLISYDRDSLDNIFNKLRYRKDIDFSEYKLSTILRRLNKRLNFLNLHNLKEYEIYLSKNSDEIEYLLNDLLIGVTHFFRDADSFEKLREELLNLIESKRGDYNLRVWVAGCSTGEEAYSIAILLSEIVDIKKYKIKVIATDIDQKSINFAKRGVYSKEALKELDETKVKRYFRATKDGYKVIKPIRDLILFSKHNILKEPSFLNLDLISCRNLLIYFNKSTQSEILKTFHYSLNIGAILFLGRSEAIGEFKNLFQTLDSKHKIYRSLILDKSKHAKIYRNIAPKIKTNSNKKEQEREVEDKLLQKLKELIFPISVVVDNSMNVIFLSGDNPYLKLSSGFISTNIFDLIDKNLYFDLKNAIFSLKDLSDDEVIKSSFKEVEINSKKSIVRLLVTKMSINSDRFYIIFFQQESEVDTLELFNKISKDRYVDLKLKSNQKKLEKMLKELENSNEEMQVLNEELQNSNEELQSANEELETTNEELETTNEELQIAYSELQNSYRDTQISKEKLKRINQRYESAINFATDGLWDWNLATDELYLSPRWKYILGYKDSELSNKFQTFKELIHKDDYSRVMKMANRYINGDLEKFKVEFRLKDKFGNYRWILSKGRLYIDSESKAQRFIGFHTDLSEHKRLEEKLIQDKKYIKTIIDAQPNIVAINDGEELIDINREFFKRFTEFESLKDFKKKYSCICELFEKSDREDYIYDGKDGKKWLKILEENREKELFVLIKQRDKYHHFMLNFKEIDFKDYKRIVISLTDITELQEYRDSLESRVKSEIESRVKNDLKFKNFFEQSLIGLIVASKDGKFLETNRAFENMVGYSQEELKSLRFSDITYEEDLGNNLKEYQKILNKESDGYILKKRYVKKDNSLIYANVSVKAVRDKNRDIEYFIGITQDITNEVNAQKESERQRGMLIQQNKLASIGEMLSAIAHQWRQPLNIIGLVIQELQTKYELSGEISKEHIDRVVDRTLDQLDFLSHTIDDFRSFFKPSRDKSRFMVDELISSVLNLIKAQLKNHFIDYEFIIESNSRDGFDLYGYRNELEHAILNILNNAKDAIISAQRKDNKLKGKIAITLTREDDEIVIDIVDNGGGVPKKNLEKIFEPYFTTKFESQGTGIGLYMSKMLIERSMGGKLSVSNEKDGAKFKIEFFK